MRSRDRVFEYHQALLDDRMRLDAFDQAIRAVVKPGDVVVDLGCGTGILSLYACRAGARRVYAVEDGDVAALASEVFRTNGVDDRVVLIRKRSTQAIPPERADVMIGYVGPAEGMLSSFIDARERWLKADGRILPTRAQIIAAPVSCASEYERLVSYWQRGVAEFDFTPLRRLASQHRYVMSLPPEELRAQPVPVLDIDLREVDTPFAVGTSSFPITSRGVVHGLCASLAMDLLPGIVLSRYSPNPAPSLNHLLLPLPTPVDVLEGDRLDVRLSTYDGQTWRWEIKALRDGSVRGSFDQSTFSGFPLDLPTLRVRGERPTGLSAVGRAAEVAMAGFGHALPLDEIVASVFSAHGTVFPTLSAARAFVMDLAERFAIGSDPKDS
jgi:protein arginine N-methyltransferase 1